MADVCKAWEVAAEPAAVAGVRVVHPRLGVVLSPKGGALGNIGKMSYGKEFAQALARLKPGEVSEPIQSPYGFHIIKWEPIGDDVLLTLCKQDFAREKNRELVSQIERGSKIERG